MARQAKEADFVITTALTPGKPAPKLISADMVKSMKPGSVIVDMAGEQGGNCELTEPGQSVVRHGVTIIGYTDLASRLAKQSSTLYAANLLRLADVLGRTAAPVPIRPGAAVGQLPRHDTVLPARSTRRPSLSNAR